MPFLGFLSSIFGGGVTGLLGAGLQRVMDYKSKQLDLELEQKKMEHEIELRKADAAIMAQEWAARTQVATIEAGAKVDVADSAAFAASFATEPQKYSQGAALTPAQVWVMVLLDLFRGVVRPAMTVYLCIIVTMLYLDAQAIAAVRPVKDTDVLALLTKITDAILYIWTTVSLWWFGTRNKQAPPKAGG